PDRGDDHDRAFAARSHPRDRQRAEPDVALDVRAHDLVEGLVLDVEQRAVIGIDRGGADQDVDLAGMLDGACYQRRGLAAAPHASRRKMCTGMTWASPPVARIPEATSSHGSALRLEITPLAPSFASSS